jgi:hypothetical protein
MKRSISKWAKACLLLLVAVSYCSHLWSQQVPKVIPPSPNAANLGQFVNTPMGMYTGTPIISIPVWTVKEGKLSLPISLSYQGGGIKVSAMASSCGLGWVLNAGGAVTRSVIGLPDETPSSGYWYSRFPYTSTYDFGYASGIADGSIDGQQDLFFYSLPGKSGRFVFDKNQAVHTIPRQNHIIKPGTPAFLSFPAPWGAGGATAIAQWTITDDDGITYKFADYEKTTSLSRERSETPGSSNYTKEVSAWYLTEMISPSKDTIKFTYEDVELTYDLPGMKTLYIKTSGGGAYDLSGSNLVQRQYAATKRLSTITFSSGKIEFIASSIGRADLIGDKALEKIIVKDKAGNIVKQFGLQYQYLAGTSLLAFNAVNFSGENNSITPIEASLPGSFNRRLLLQQVVEQDKNGTNLNDGYRLDYIHDYGLPNRASELMDHWGYANKADDPLQPRPAFVFAGGDYQLTEKSVNSVYCKQGSLYRVTYPTGGYAEYEYEPNTAGASPSTPPDIVTGSIAMLPFSHASYLTQESYDYIETQWQGTGPVTRHHYVPLNLNLTSTNIKIYIRNMPYYITGELGYYLVNMANPNTIIWSGFQNGTYSLANMPPGSYRLYHHPSPALLANHTQPDYGALYEAEVEGSFGVFPADPGSPLAGGIRVKKTTLYDPVANTTINKLYSYVLDGSSGHLLSTPTYLYELDAYTGGDGDQHYKVCSYSSIYPLSTTHGSYVGYEFVTEQTFSSTGDTLGKTEYSYISPGQQPDLFYTHGNPFFPSQAFPNPPVDNRDWLRGFLTRQEDYKYSSNTYTPVRTITTTYTKVIDSVSKGIKMDITKRNTVQGTLDFAFNQYYIYSGQIYPGQTQETGYDGSNSITTITTTVNSEKSLLPVKKSVIKSDGTIQHSFINYPLEYAAGEPFIDSLVKRNIVSVPVEVVIGREASPGALEIMAGNVFTFRSDNAEKEGEYQMETNTTIPLASFKFSNAVTGQVPAPNNQTVYMPDNRYKLRVKINAYDSKGNITEVQKAGNAKSAYIWGYDNTLPIAEVINALAKDVFYTSFEDAEGNSTDGDSKTGRKSKTGGYNKSLAGLTNGSYRLTWWLKSGGTWNLQTSNPVISAGAYTISLTGQVDEVRFYPVTAQMSTYTYDQLIGITSQCDMRNIVTYYEYDSFTRLLRIRDENNNILKQFAYQYAAYDRPDAVWQVTGNTRCKPCPANGNYTSNVFQQEERDVNAGSATYNQTRWTDAGSCYAPPDFQPTGNTRCVKDGSNNNTGAVEQERRDMNPCSNTYNQLQWVNTGQNCATCPTPANWQPTGNTRCAKDGSNNNTGDVEQERRDMNSCSNTYNQLQWVNTGQNCAACAKPANWQPTGNLRCVKNAGNQNTGFQEREERDNETCSGTYNQLRWVNIGQNLTACPLPPTCTTGNCSGVDKKCVNGVCETGVKVFFGGPQIGPSLYQCSYKYQWSDGSLSSQTFTENHSTPCPNDFEG